jgi:hypothetical protein
VCACVCERERESVCVCARERDRERELSANCQPFWKERECVREREREWVCLCVCVRERERAFCQLPNRTIKLTKPLTCKADMHFVWRVERDNCNISPL